MTALKPLIFFVCRSWELPSTNVSFLIETNDGGWAQSSSLKEVAQDIREIVTRDRPNGEKVRIVFKPQHDEQLIMRTDFKTKSVCPMTREEEEALTRLLSGKP